MTGDIGLDRSVRFSVFVAISFLVCSFLLSAETEREKQVRTLYEKGVQQLEEKNIDKAYNSFQRAIEEANKLAPEVRGELLRWLWEQTSTRLFDRMLEDPKLRHAAERILELSKGAYWSWKMDESRIDELVNNLTGQDYKARLEAQRKLQAAGEYAAPRLIEEMGASDAEARSMAVMTLSDMGGSVVLPVIEALESSDETQRRNAALVLGNLEDARALPALKKTYEKDDSNLVRREAREAIMNILSSRLPTQIKKALQASGRTMQRRVLRGRVDRLLVRLAQKKQDHTHQWGKIKEDHLRLGGSDGEKKESGSSRHLTWEGASELGLKNIYVDDAGLKYIEHTHDVKSGGRVKEDHTHRHYLAHLRGLPSQLKQHVFRKRADRSEEIVTEQLDRLLSKSARENQGHHHSWNDVKDDVYREEGEQQSGKETQALDRKQWPGARSLGLKNIYEDDTGMKYIVHQHEKEEEGENVLGKHRHYLRNISGLPSRLKGYVDYWRALDINLYEAQTFHNLASSEKLYHRLAESYYHAEPSVMKKLYGDALVWNWNEKRQQVESHKVPEFAHNLELAAQAGLDGLDSNVRYRPNWPLLVSIYFSIYEESETILSHGEELTRMEVLSEKSLKRMREDLKGRDLMLLPGQLISDETLYATLSKSIREEKYAVGVKSLKFLSEFMKTEDLPDVDAPAWEQEEALAYPVVASLSSGSKTMEYMAASMLVKREPRTKFYEWSQVIPSLSEAVNLTGVRKIVISSENQDQINRLRKVVRDPNIQADMVIARNTRELISKVKSPPVADLVLVDADMLGKVLYSFSVPGRKKDHQQRVIDALKQDMRSRKVPLVAIADDASQKSEVEETYRDRVDRTVESPVTVKKLMDLLEQGEDGLVTESAGLEFKRDAGKLALRAARALASIDTRDTVFTNYSGAVVALYETLEDRPDKLRVAASRALGRIGDRRAIPPLLKTLDREDDPSEVRAAAGHALAQIFRKLEFRPSDTVLEILVETANKGPNKVQSAAARAFGAADVKPERRFELLKQIKRQLSDKTANAQK